MVINIRVLRVLTFCFALIPLFLFFWMNQQSYGNPFQLAGTVGSVSDIDKNGKPALPKDIYNKKNIDALLNPDKQHKSALLFFQSRNLLNGMYIDILSPDRGVIYFTPVILIGLVGAFFLMRANKKYFSLFMVIIGCNFLIYTMWGDPWGGWAFGTRYLIPSYAILSITLAFYLSKFRNNIIFLLLFLILLIYSTMVNTVGAITSNTNPPQVQIAALQKISCRVEKYSYDRNIGMLEANVSRSFVWQTYIKSHMNAVSYYAVLVTLLIALELGLMTTLFVQRREHDLV